jgi:hypothetical protein
MFNWIDKQDGIDDVLAEDINNVAHAVMDLEGNNKNVADQTFNPSSTNAQSGIAVAEGIKGEVDKFGIMTINDLKDGTFNKRLDFSDPNITPIVRNLTIASVYEKIEFETPALIQGLNTTIYFQVIESTSGVYSDRPTTDMSSDNMLTNKGYVDGKIGDIESALDSIIAIQEQLIGGAE